MRRSNKIACWMGILGIFCLSLATAQNEPPRLENAHAVWDSLHKRVEISYDISDQEDERFRISCRISHDGGITFESRTHEMTGDIGNAVGPGAGKKIFWNYSQEEMDIRQLRVQLMADDLQKLSIQALTDQVDSTELHQNLQMIYGIRDHSRKSQTHLETVKRFIETRATDSHLPFRRQAFQAKCSGENIIITKEGVGEGRRKYIVSAHFDSSKKSPGADDNATGVSAILEIMRILAPYSLTHTLEFVAFDCEESGLLGSKAFVEQIDPSMSTPLDGVINLDMIGYYSTEAGSQQIPETYATLFPEASQAVASNQYKGDFVLCAYDEAASGLNATLSASIKQYVPELKLISLEVIHGGSLTPSLASSDHASFWQAGYKAIHLGDGAFSRNPATNSKKDKLDTVHLPFMQNIVKATLAAIAIQAEARNCTLIDLEVEYPPAN